MQRVMMAVESNKVPSQSKAIKSNCRDRCSLGLAGCSMIGKRFQVGGQRSQQFDSLAADRMINLQAPGVQEHALEAWRIGGAQQCFIQFKVTVFNVTCNRKTFPGKMNPNLMRRSAEH